MASYDERPPSRPAVAAAVQDLSDAEFAELDGLLADVPEPLEPLDVVMLDGYLAAIVVQPEFVDVERWLPHVFDASGHRWGEAEPSAEQLRARLLILRRHAAINRSLAEFGAFDPLILEPGEAVTGQDAEQDAAPASGTAVDAVSLTGPLGPIGEAIVPWVAGFEFATSIFPALVELPDDDVNLALARLYRFLPLDDDGAVDDSDDGRGGALDGAAAPLLDGHAISDLSLDDAIEEVIACVADLYDLTTPMRYRVDTVRREAPKVGRNDPCPCGSGRKYKICHGKA